LRILLIAEACNPSWTSVPLAGYNLARALAARDDLDVTLVTQVRNRAALKTDPLQNLVRLCFLDTEWVARPCYQLSKLLRGDGTLSWTTSTGLAWPSYIAFEWAIYRRLRQAFASGQFDLIHRITPLTPTVGSPLATWTNVPFLLGPLNGGLP